MDAVATATWRLNFGSDLAIIANTLNRYAEDFVIWSMSEFGYLTLSDFLQQRSSDDAAEEPEPGMKIRSGRRAHAREFLRDVHAREGRAPDPAAICRKTKEPVFDAVHENR